MKIPNPQSKTFIQYNESDTGVQGNIHISFNLDLTSQKGRIRVSPRMVQTTDGSTAGVNFGVPVAFAYFNGLYWAAAGTRMFNAATFPSVTFGPDISTGTPSGFIDQNYSDLKTYTSNSGQFLFATGNSTALNKLGTSGSWTNISSVLANASYPHMMTYYSAVGSLYITDYTRIVRFYPNESFLPAITIADPREFYMTGMISGSNRIWVGGINLYGNAGKIVEWDGITTQFIREYPIQAQGVIAGIMKGGIPYFIDTDGYVLRYAPGDFQRIGRFPVSFDTFLSAATSTSNSRFVHWNGMSINNQGNIEILLNNGMDDAANSIDTRCPSGIWELVETANDDSLYHRTSLTYYPQTGGTISDYGQNRIQRSGALRNVKLDNNATANQATRLAGAAYYKTDGTAGFGIWCDDLSDTVQKSGYFITPKLESSQLDDIFQKVYVKHRQFLNSGDKIIVKYRTTDLKNAEYAATWASTSTLTISTTLDLSIYKEGDEIEITQGIGSGKCVNISKIDKTVVGATTNYIFTVDDLFTGATGTAMIRFGKWKQAGVLTNTSNQLDELPLSNSRSTWIQLKFIFIFTGKDEVEEFDIINKTDKQQ